MDESKLWRQAEAEYDWFDKVYQAAGDDYQQIPWARCQPNRMLMPLLAEGRLSALGEKAVVVGCGLGDDAELLANNGFAVTAFDISPEAIRQAKKRFPESPVRYLVADLFALAPEMLSAFDLVFEASTLQALPPHLVHEAQKAITALLSPQGILVVVAFGRTAEQALPQEPPWPLLKQDLDHFQQCGLREIDVKSVNIESGARPGLRHRILYRWKEL